MWIVSFHSTGFHRITQIPPCPLAFVYLKGQFTHKKNISLFTDSHIVPNLYEFLFSVEHKIRYFEKGV